MMNINVCEVGTVTVKTTNNKETTNTAGTQEAKLPEDFEPKEIADTESTLRKS
jgi:hypothetical protein